MQSNNNSTLIYTLRLFDSSMHVTELQSGVPATGISTSSLLLGCSIEHHLWSNFRSWSKRRSLSATWMRLRWTPGPSLPPPTCPRAGTSRSQFLVHASQALKYLAASATACPAASSTNSTSPLPRYPFGYFWKRSGTKPLCCSMIRFT